MSENTKVKRGKLSDLKPLVNNPNAGSERGQYMLEESFTQAGAGRSILIAANGDILAGNHASEAYGQLLDNDEVLIVETDGKTLVAVQRTDIASADDPKGKTLIIADNRASDFHEYDAGVIKDLLATDEALIKHYFMEDELQALLAEIAEEPPADPGAQVDRAAELQKVWNVERGQVWEIPSKATPGKSHRVMCGDSTDKADVDKLMGGAKADLLWSDPPYGLGGYAGRSGKFDAVKGDDAERDELIGFFEVGQCENMYICCEWKTYPYLLAARGEPRSLIVWAKNNFGMGNGYRRQHEFIGFYGQFDSTTETDLWQVDRDAVKDYMHPTQKPTELPKRAILNSSKRHSAILDPFLGSGTTLIAAEQTARVCYGMEIAPEYVSVILERAKGIGLTPQVMNG